MRLSTIIAKTLEVDIQGYVGQSPKTSDVEDWHIRARELEKKLSGSRGRVRNLEAELKQLKADYLAQKKWLDSRMTKLPSSEEVY